jgi:hypothetical protein
MLGVTKGSTAKENRFLASLIYSFDLLEYRQILAKDEIEYDERYVWD